MSKKYNFFGISKEIINFYFYMLFFTTNNNFNNCYNSIKYCRNC